MFRARGLPPSSQHERTGADAQSAGDSSVLAEEDLPDSDGEFPPRRCRCGELRRFCRLDGDGHQTESDASETVLSGSEDSEDECRAPPCDPDLCRSVYRLRSLRRRVLACVLV